MLKRIKLSAAEGDFELLKEAAVSMSVSHMPSVTVDNHFDE